MLNWLLPLDPLFNDATVVDRALKEEPPFRCAPSRAEGICVAGVTGLVNVAVIALTVTARGQLDFTCKVEMLALVRPLWYLVTSSKRKLVLVEKVKNYIVSLRKIFI